MRTKAWRTGVVALGLALAVLLASGCTGRPSGSVYEKVEIEVPPGAKGPERTDFATNGFRIDRVLWQEKRLTALGVAARHVGDRGVGRFHEGRKRLRRSERGELYLINWIYRGEPIADVVTVEFSYRLQKQPDPSTATAVFAGVHRGTYGVRFHNIGIHFREKGKVTAWRVRLAVADKVVAQKSSFSWNLLAMEQSRPGQEVFDDEAAGP